MVCQVKALQVLHNVGGMKSKRIARDELSTTTEDLTGNKAPK